MNSIYTAEQVKAFEKSSFVNKGDDLLAMMEAANNSVDELVKAYPKSEFLISSGFLPPYISHNIVTMPLEINASES